MLLRLCARKDCGGLRENVRPSEIHREMVGGKLCQASRYCPYGKSRRRPQNAPSGQSRKSQQLASSLCSGRLLLAQTKEGRQAFFPSFTKSALGRRLQHARISSRHTPLFTK
jgi:hypothetical protein